MTGLAQSHRQDGLAANLRQTCLLCRIYRGVHASNLLLRVEISLDSAADFWHR